MGRSQTNYVSNGEERMESIDQTRPQKRLRVENQTHIDAIYEDSQSDSGSERENQTDGKTDESEDDAFVEAEAAQQTNDKDRSSTECGLIKVVELINFMCHRHLKLNLGPKINFIIGHNGSGKSAILTAIMVGLGGKAAVTNRASNMKDLIRSGENFAQVMIKLQNSRSDAYRPEVFGDTIEIERRILKDGVGAYRIKSCSGAVISTKKEELTAICDHLGIQIDNPMSILSQDTARQFLSESSPEEKYQLFYKAVELDVLERDYETVKEALSKTNAAISMHNSNFEILAEAYKRAETLYNRSRRNDNLYTELVDCKKKMAWSQVVVEEKKVEHIGLEIQQTEKQLQEAVEGSNQAKFKLENIEKELLSDETNIDKFNNSVEEHERAKKETKSRVSVFDSKLSDFMVEEQEINNKIAEESRRIETITEKFHARNSAENDQAQTLILSRELTSRQNELNELRNQKTSLDNELKLIDMASYKYADKREKLRHSINESCRKESDLKQYIQRLKNTADEKYSAFHVNMHKVIREISANKTIFNTEPLGPLGGYVKILKEEWSDVVERIFGRSLNAFIVTNYPDKEKLNAILRKNQCSVPIVVAQRDAFDYSAGEPDSRFDTVLRILQIDNEYVKRQLINSNHIESTILIPDRDKADDIMYNLRPARVSACYALHHQRERYGWKIGANVGSSSISPVFPWNGPYRIRQNVGSQIREAECDLQKLRGQVEQMKEEGILAEADSQEQQSLKTKALNMMRNVNSSISQLESRIEEIKLTIDAEKAINTTELLTESLKDAQTDLGRYEQQYMDLIAEKDALLQQKKQETSVLSQIVALLHSSQNLLKEAKENLLMINSQKVSVEHEIALWKEKQSNLKTIISDFNQQKEAQILIVKQSNEDAIAICGPDYARPSTLESPEVYDKRIRHLEQRKHFIEKELGALTEDVQVAYIKARKEYNEAEVMLRSLETLSNKLQESWNTRTKKFFRFRKFITVRTKLWFIKFLAFRDYSGKVLIKHKTRTLELKVYTNSCETEGKDKDPDPRNLSGGEKSFAQICLLLSIWEAMSCPLRCLDEFDVFMDPVNRRMTMKMMIETARHNSNTQHILITPQEMGSIAFGPDVRVVRLNDPERRQTTIEFNRPT